MESFDDVVVSFNEDLDRELSQSSLNFPTCFDMVRKIAEMADDLDVSLKDFATLIQTEPVIFAKVLRMANSAGLNPYGRNVTNAMDAIQRLGIQKLKCLVYVVSMEQLLKDFRSPEVKQLAKTIWKHSLEVSCWSFVIGKRIDGVNPDTAMLAGMMVDIGQFFILSRSHQYPTIEQHSDLFLHVVQGRHEDVSKQLLDIFQLPEVVLKLYNFDYFRQPQWPLKTLLDVVLLANLVGEIRNPFLQIFERCKKQMFEDNLNEDELRSIHDFIESLREEQQAYYQLLTNV